MLRCADKSYYVGSTSYQEIDARVGEHNDGRFDGYTSKRRPVTLVWSEWFEDLQQAHAAEQRIKGWRREKKEALIRHDYKALPALAKRPGARRDGACFEAPLRGAPQHDERGKASKSNPEVRAKRASKDGPGEPK